MVVEAAGADGIEVTRLAALTGREDADLINLGALVVVRMRIGRHEVRARVVVDEQHARAGSDRERFWGDASRADGDRASDGRAVRR